MTKKVIKKESKKVENNINENEVNNKTNGTVICHTKHIDMKTGEVLSSKNIIAYDDGLKEISIGNQAEDLSKLSKEELLERVNQLKKENSKLKPQKGGEKLKKTSMMYDFLSRFQGVKIKELMNEFGWQKHSVRGVMSNVQKDYQFKLIRLETSTPDPKSEIDKVEFIKDATYYARDVEFEPVIIDKKEYERLKALDIENTK